MHLEQKVNQCNYYSKGQGWTNINENIFKMVHISEGWANQAQGLKVSPLTGL